MNTNQSPNSKKQNKQLNNNSNNTTTNQSPNSKKQNKQNKTTVATPPTQTSTTTTNTSTTSTINVNITNGNSNTNGVEIPTSPILSSLSLSQSDGLFKDYQDDNLLVEDITQWSSRTLLIHNIMPGMDEKVIRDILGSQFKYTFKPAGKPNQLYILFISPNEAKQCFYNQLTGVRKIDNSGQSCIKICFDNEYKTVIRCTNPDPFPLNTLSPSLSPVGTNTIISPNIASSIGGGGGPSTPSTIGIKSNLVATSSSFEPSNFHRNIQLNSSNITLNINNSGSNNSQQNNNSSSSSNNSYFQFNDNTYYHGTSNSYVNELNHSIYTTHSPVIPPSMVYSQSSIPQFNLEGSHLHQYTTPVTNDSVYHSPINVQQQQQQIYSSNNFNSPNYGSIGSISSPINQPHHNNISTIGSVSHQSPNSNSILSQSPIIQHHHHHHTSNSNNSNTTTNGGNGSHHHHHNSQPQTNIQQSSTQHSKKLNKKYQFINELLKLTEKNQVIVYPGNQLSTLPRVPTFVFDKLPNKFSFSQHLDQKEKKSTILTGFLREFEDKKRSVGYTQRSNDSDGYYNGHSNDYHGHHHGHHHSDDSDDEFNFDEFPEDFFKDNPELRERYENYRVFYYTCYEKTTPTINLISNLGKGHLKERCGRLSVLLLTDWAPDNSYAIGTIQFFNGTPMDLLTISKCILVNHQVFHSDHFDKELVEVYEDWLPPEEEEKRRVDLTHLIPVTIDPPSSTDLDDALSFRFLPDEKSDGQSVFEIGIHISDVSYFLEKSSKLDLEAEYRLNTIYLIGSNIPMLPKNLSSHTCSLKLYQKRFCFSLLIKIRADGKIIDKRFCKSFLRSQGHLSYDKAQRIINKYKGSYQELNDSFNNTEMKFHKGANEIIKSILEKHFTKCETTTTSSPNIFNNNGTNDLETKVHLSIWGLYLISSLLNNDRKERREIFDIGGNLQFDLSLDGVPYNLDFLPKLESHVLVQEFMHLANNLAANSLLTKNYEYGILYSTIIKQSCNSNGNTSSDSTFDNRKKFFDRLNVFIRKFNPSVTISSTQDDWKSIKQKVEDSNQYCTIEQSKAMRRLAMHLMDPSKYMTTIEKRQASAVNSLKGEDGQPTIQFDERAQYCHYSSPIRRYCDVNIHRALSLQLTEKVQWTQDCLIKPYWESLESPEYLKFKQSLPIGQQLETLCQKYNDISWKRKISEKLNLLYLTTYLWEQGPMSTPGVVIAMSSKHLVIYLVNFNLEVSSDKSDFLSINISKDDSYVMEDDEDDLEISKQLMVFVSVEPFTLFRNNLIPKIKISKYHPSYK